MHTESCLHYLLPDKRDLDIVNKLRKSSQYQTLNQELTNLTNLLFHFTYLVSLYYMCCVTQQCCCYKLNVRIINELLVLIGIECH